MPITTDSLPNTYGADGITRLADVAGLPPTVSPSAAVIIADSQLSDQNITRAMKAYKMLHEQWGCDEPGHDLCLQGAEYIGHIQLSEEQISIWIGEICRGQATCHYPPDVFIVPDGSRSNRNANFDWGASGTDTDTEVEVGPGYFCGLALERVGRTILHHSKVSLFLAKLSLYRQIVNRWPLYRYRRLYKRPSAQSLGIILQETADLMRPSYPLYIRKQAFNVFGGRTWSPIGYRDDDYIHIILEWLGLAFRCSREDHGSPEIMSALYQHLTSAPLHIHYDEVLSNFIVILCRYVSSWERDYDSLPYTLTQIMVDLCHLRRLSFKELNAIHDYLESWLQQQSNSRWSYNRHGYFIRSQMEVSIPCSRQDARFHIISEALLDIALDTNIGATSRHGWLDYSFRGKGRAVNTFFEDRVLLIDHAKKINRIASHISIQPDQGLMFSDLASTIKTIVSLIAASPDPEFSCRGIQAENVVNPFVNFFSHFDPLDFRDHPHDFRDFSRLKSDSHSLLLLIANPFTGPSVLSNSHFMSILEDNGRVRNAPSASN
ncbi:hypothetical protein BU17DRAFT_91501 [Hysterangium stoloniferum]|nr:hypothetical protein BU17DRAFT_91501 [Hysterangium stoloniferum]